MKKMLLPVFLLAFAACSKDDTTTTTTDCGTTTKSYATDVSPVIASSCATSTGCHASGSANGPGALTTYQQVYNARTDIRKSVNNGSMPQGSTLSSTNKNAILCWIDAGAPNN